MQPDKHTHVNPEPRTPPEKVSDEAKSKKSLELAREQGRAIEKAVEHMTQQVAETGAEVRAGDYVVGFAVEKAEGLWHMRNGELVWHEPQEENCHIEVAVRDGGDGRFIPALDVRVSVLDAQGTEIGSHVQPFLWHPYLYHYGRNWKVPGDGVYTLRVHIGVPQFPRHDRKNGKRFTEPVDVEFRDVRIKTGKG